MEIKTWWKKHWGEAGFIIAIILAIYSISNLFKGLGGVMLLLDYL